MELMATVTLSFKFGQLELHDKEGFKTLREILKSKGYNFFYEWNHHVGNDNKTGEELIQSPKAGGEYVRNKYEGDDMKLREFIVFMPKDATDADNEYVVGLVFEYLTYKGEKPNQKEDPDEYAMPTHNFITGEKNPDKLPF